MPIAKVFFGMSLKRDEEVEPQAVAEKAVVGEKEDVKAGRRRRAGGGAGKMRLRGKGLGSRKVRLEEASLDREAKKLERKQIALAKRMSRLEMKKSGKPCENEDGAKKAKRGRSVEKKEKKSRSESRSKKDRSQSRKEKKEKKASGFIKRRREMGRTTSESSGILKVEVSIEEKIAKKEARQAKREAKQTERLLKKEERIAKKAAKNPYRIKIRPGKLLKAPQAFRSMQRAACRR
ncbi:hypothetical protein CRE_31395 [Caenorhabditis remanei]|uniref:Uncharacterized protein n=1 Tax=Caenorhabditis remanei TaxID=31234 RepID=E3N5T9_CAERE|nr:hypothetical protein CRE_31395 [Caenorhabditis remanei]